MLLNCTYHLQLPHIVSIILYSFQCTLFQSSFIHSSMEDPQFVPLLVNVQQFSTPSVPHPTLLHRPTITQHGDEPLVGIPKCQHNMDQGVILIKHLITLLQLIMS